MIVIQAKRARASFSKRSRAGSRCGIERGRTGEALHCVSQVRRLGPITLGRFRRKYSTSLCFPRYISRISLAFVAPGQVEDAAAFAISLSLEPKDLSKLAAAVERIGLHLGVWPQHDELRVWGITRNLPAFCLILEVILPGLLVVKQSPSEESGKFINIAVLQGDEIKIIDPQAAMSAAYPKLLTSLLRLESQFATGSEVNVLLQLAVSMRAHGRGGMLLVVPMGRMPGRSPSFNRSLIQLCPRSPALRT
ncbi:MAG TPA: hypothetical protein VKX49_07025 [Bryobacteraceae bacterium]|nr:hypothetical protein [Bryobacteraceae bacterium]